MLTEVRPNVLHHAVRVTFHDRAHEASLRADLLRDAAVDQRDSHAEHMLVPRIHLVVLVERNTELANNTPDLVHAKQDLEANQPFDVVVRAGQGLQVELVIVLVLGRVDKGLDVAEGLRLLRRPVLGGELWELVKVEVRSVVQVIDEIVAFVGAVVGVVGLRRDLRVIRERLVVGVIGVILGRVLRVRKYGRLEVMELNTLAGLGRFGVWREERRVSELGARQMVWRLTLIGLVFGIRFLFLGFRIVIFGVGLLHLNLNLLGDTLSLVFALLVLD
jgi:hypothetical protein